MRTESKVLGQLLLQRGLISHAGLSDALARQLETGARLGEILAAASVVSGEELSEVLAAQLKLPFAPAPLKPHEEACRLLRAAWARKKKVVPVGLTPRSLTLAMADPLDIATLDDVQFQCGRRADAVVATLAAVEESLSRAYPDDFRGLLSQLEVGEEPQEEDNRAALERAAASTPVVQVLDGILREAVSQGASDVHIEPGDKTSCVRYRVDGVLRPVMEFPRRAHAPVLSRLKVMAGMDISVKRVPQDGGMALPELGAGLTVRVSTLPMRGGEKAVIRLLDSTKAPENLDALGLSPPDLKRLRRALGAGHGVILAAGPTGSGKTSTIFGALGEADRASLNVVTLEDPVEYHLPGVNQVQVDPRSGLTFPTALRSVLRQDPDAVMVGEIRDRETAEIAMTAAVTGHLVLSTVHTIDAPGAITRLLDMGVAGYLLAGGLHAVVAQRLLRRVCRTCRAREEHCPDCIDGYRGRTGVFQVLTMNDRLREAVMRGESTSALRRIAQEDGMSSMVEDARRKVAEGVTTPHEISRVLSLDPGSGVPCAHCSGEIPDGANGCSTCGRPTAKSCPCGRRMAPGWRYCPWCLRRVPG